MQLGRCRKAARSSAVAAAVLLTTALAPAVASSEEAIPPAVEDEPDVVVQAPSRATGATVARIVAPTFARRRLGGPRSGWRVGTATAWSGQSQILLVLAARTHGGRDWVKVLLANRPNGSAGWVPRDHVVLGRTSYWIDIRVGARRVTVSRTGRRVRQFRAVVGAPATPTPLGLSAVYERNRQPDPRAFLGPWVLSLTSLSNVLRNYGGGPGRVGIHGRAGESFKDPLGCTRASGRCRADP